MTVTRGPSGSGRRVLPAAGGRVLTGLPCGIHPVRRGGRLGSGLRWAPLGNPPKRMAELCGECDPLPALHADQHPRPLCLPPGGAEPLRPGPDSGHLLSSQAGRSVVP